MKYKAIALIALLTLLCFFNLVSAKDKYLPVRSKVIYLAAVCKGGASFQAVGSSGLPACLAGFASPEGGEIGLKQMGEKARN